jgi:hypothetical protein
MEKSNNKIRKILNIENGVIVKKLEEMKSSNKYLSKKERGITLIALVITIALNCCRSGRKKECIA